MRRRTAAISLAVLAFLQACLAVFSIVRGSPADEPNARLMLVFGIGSLFAGRAAYKRFRPV